MAMFCIFLFSNKNLLKDIKTSNKFGGKKIGIGENEIFFDVTY